MKILEILVTHNQNIKVIYENIDARYGPFRDVTFIRTIKEPEHESK